MNIKFQLFSVLALIVVSCTETSLASEVKSNFNEGDLKIPIEDNFSNKNINTRAVATWNLFARNERTSIDQLWITRIAYHPEPITYAICRSSESGGIRISAPVIIYLDGKIALPPKIPHSLDSGSCTVVTAKVIDLSYRGKPLRGQYLEGTYARLDNKSLASHIYSEFFSWQSNWQRSISPPYTRSPLVIGIANNYRICFDSQTQAQRNLTRKDKVSWLIGFGEKEKMSEHPLGLEVKFQEGSCIDIDGKSHINVYPHSEPKEYDYYFMRGKIYTLDSN